MKKPRGRRAEIRKNLPPSGFCWQDFRESGALASIAVAAVFCLLVAVVLLWREEVVPYRPGQTVSHDIVSRVDFVFHDPRQLAEARQRAKAEQPRVYAAQADVWESLERELLRLPERLAGAATVEDVEPTLREQLQLDSGSLTRFGQYHAESDRGFERGVREYVDTLRGLNLVILPASQRAEELASGRRQIELPQQGRLALESTYSTEADESLTSRIQRLAQQHFLLELQPKVLNFTLSTLQPTHRLDNFATAEARSRAEAGVPVSAGDRQYRANMVLVPKDKGLVDERDWQILRAEHEAYLASLGGTIWKSRLGTTGLAVLITLLLALYIGNYQPRVACNHTRAIAIAGLLLSMLLLPQLAAIGSSSLYIFGIAPTILVAMIIAIAYDRRFAIGVGTVHALLVTFALSQGVGFFLVLWVGVMTCCFLLDEIRTRSKLIEVGGAAAMMMIAASFAAGALNMDPLATMARNGLYAGAAGFGVGFIVLGILPFVEKAFRITTSMTLLELADVSHPVLRRLSMEAPGSYNHSLQVATLAEAAAEAIGADALLCRVGSYYHDIGKINKAEYFVENQVNGQNRHLNLSPSVSLLIIIGHVKDGVAMAKEYNLPPSLLPFIQQHHGTTLVEYFYHQAVSRERRPGDSPSPPAVSETQYRYPGPKPRSREVAVVMLADAVESAARAMPEPTAARLENLVRELAMKRLLDGQFDECDLTMRELELIERSLIKTMHGMYHGRVAYPSTAGQAAAAPAEPGMAASAAKTA